MPSRRGFFIVKPKSKLLNLADAYNQNDWRDVLIWIIPEISDYVADRESNYAGYIKIAMLGDIIQKFELLTMENIYPNFIKIVHEIFGTPPHFSIATLDEYWSFERADKSRDYSYVISQIPNQILRQIQRTGLPELDEWLEVNTKTDDIHD